MASHIGALERARAIIATSERIVVLTGAGISTDSGIPDFRGPDGVWTKNPAAERASNIAHWVGDPDVRRAAWTTRLESANRPAPRPNAGHQALVDLQATGRLALLVTQNIDGLHREAGTDPDLLVEIHGTSAETICLACGDRRPMASTLARVRAGDADPACTGCGGMLKSATISFGQGLVEADLARAEAGARECDLLLAIGSTLSVYPVAAMVPIALGAGAAVVIVNGEPTAFDTEADVVVRGSISEVLPSLW